MIIVSASCSILFVLRLCPIQLRAFHLSENGLLPPLPAITSHLNETLSIEWETTVANTILYYFSTIFQYFIANQLIFLRLQTAFSIDIPFANPENIFFPMFLQQLNPASKTLPTELPQQPVPVRYDHCCQFFFRGKTSMAYLKGKSMNAVQGGIPLSTPTRLGSIKQKKTL